MRHCVEASMADLDDADLDLGEDVPQEEQEAHVNEAIEDGGIGA